MKTIYTYAPYLVILALTAALITKCENLKDADKTISALQTENKTYKLENGKTAISAAVVTVPKSQTPKTAETKPFAKVESITKTVYETKIDTVFVPFKDSVKTEFSREGFFKTKDLSFKYTASQYGLGLQNMVIRDSLTLVHGVKRKWFLGEETRTVDISHSNKYVITTSVQHVEYKDPKHWTETGLFKFGCGLVGGLILRESIK